MPRYRWIEPIGANGGELSSFGLIGDILATRGVRNRTEAAGLLNHDFSTIPDPSTLPDIDIAVELIQDAIAGSQPVAVFGDYDVDGITSTALLVRALEDRGADVRAYLPHRERDGYGLNTGAIDRSMRDGCQLLISVDCGTSNRVELAHARAAGLKTIVIDHHHVPEIDIPCDAFVSPRRPDSEHPFADYAAVGVAWQLLRRLTGNEAVERYLPLAALGTVADVVPLTGPNRTIVHHGLHEFQRFAGPGLLALSEVAGVKPDAMRSHHFGFLLGPRINAAGRIDDPWAALELLLTDSSTRAEELARNLNELNRHRQELLSRYVAEAVRYVEDDGKSENPVLVIGDPDWRVGLVGLVASRLSDQFGRPAFVLEQTPSLSRGSARSIDEFDVATALHKCSDLLTRFGGHSKAAGLTLETNNIHAFDERINQLFIDEVGAVPPTPKIALDAEISPDIVSLDLLEMFHQLEPCGHGNPPPRLLMRNVAPVNAKRVGDHSHLKFGVDSGTGQLLDAISFGSGSRLPELDAAGRIDLALSLRPNTFRGRTSVTLEVVDFRPVD